MKISTKGRYAIRLMADLALHDSGEFIPLRDISKRQGITVKYLEQIIPMLTRAGFVLSSRGNGGGYRLAKPADKYIIGDILRITEGPLAPVACLESDINTCERQESCITLPFWKGLYDVINKYVDSFTIADIIAVRKAQGGDYCI